MHKNEILKFEIFEENDLTWKHHHEIHAALNAAYGYRTNAFVKKTFSYCTPKQRILCWHEDKLVGHTAIFEDYALIDKKEILIGGIGLTLSLQPHKLLGFSLRKMAVDLCKNLKYPLAVGRIKKSHRIMSNLSCLSGCHILSIS